MKKVLLLLSLVAVSFCSFAQSTANYAFSTNTTGSLALDANGNAVDMSTGTTQVIGADLDDLSSSAINIGFTFLMYANPFTQFVVSTNGVVQLGNSSLSNTLYVLSGGSTTSPRIGAFAADLRTGNAGKVHYKLVGTAPNRCLVVEFLNMSLTYVGSPGSNDGTYQVRLYETTGVIEYLYGAMYRNASTTTAAANYVGFSVGATANTTASVTVPTNVVSYGATFNVNTFTNNAVMTNLNSASNGSRRSYKFTPPVPTAVSGLNFSAIAASTMTLNWTDNSSNEAGFAIYRSTDNVTFTYLTNAAANATSYVATGLTPATTYYWQVRAVSEGYLSNAVTSSQITGLPQTYTWTATTGTAAWSAPASWTPARNVPDVTDMLEFTNGGTSTATGISTATIRRINVKNNTSINLQSAATAVLTIASDGTTTDELNIEAGSSLTLNSISAALTVNYSGSSSTGTIAGTAEVTSPATGTFANTLNFSSGTSSVTTVTATGVLAAGQSGGTGVPVISGSSIALFINGVYNHKFQVAAGSIPIAVWGSGSKVNVTGYTATVTAGPSLFNQSFYDAEWNCPLQTTNINCASSIPNVSGTFTVTSTGAGSNYLAFTATTVYTRTWVNYIQTGGNVDLGTGASGANTISISGTFNQSGGTFNASGTGTSSTTLNFSSSSTQTATFTGQPTGPIVYRISATSGITLNANVANFVVGNGTLGGIRVSTTAPTPITLGGSITSLQYASLGSTLTYDATGSYSMTATEFPASNGPANLTIAVGASNVLTMPASFVSRSLSPTGASGVLTMTSGDLDINSNNLTLGTSAILPGTLTYTAGSIRVTTGNLTRWFGFSGLPTAAGGIGIGYFPLASEANNRNVSIYFNTSSALSTGGTMTIGHINGVGTSAVTVTDGAYIIQQQTNAYWPISQNGLVASGTISARITGGGLVTTTGTNLRLMQLAAAAGNFVASSGTNPNFQVTRTALTVANIAQNQYIGAADADLGFTSIVSGNWETPATWNKNIVPTATDAITIGSGTTVTVNAVPATALSVAVNGNLVVSGSTLDIVGATTTGLSIASIGSFTVSGGTATVGTTGNNRTLANSGTLTVSSGTLNINGNLSTAAGSTFNQSGGNIDVDGNASGLSTNSVTSGTVLVSFGSALGTVNGGNLTIVDPPYAGTARSLEINLTSGTWQWGAGHTTYLGNGTSTDASTNISGFQFDTYVGSTSTQSMIGSLVINGGISTNRWATSTSAAANGSFVKGNLTINAGSELRDVSTGGRLVLAGNLTNNGTMTNLATITTFADYSGAVLVAATNAQAISGSGVFRNLTTSPTAQFSAFTINNTHADGITFAAGITPTVTGAITITDGKVTADAFTLQGSTAQAVSLAAASSFINVGDFTLNNAAGATFSGLGKLNITGTLSFGAVNSTTLATGGLIVLKSSATGTGRIGDITNNSVNFLNSISGNVTQERYIPAKAARTYSFVASPFTQSISSAWQQQVHITGAGTGGTVCPTLTAHSNGFDATVTNAASLFVYDGTKAVGSRWTSVTGTTAVSLAPGIGYRMNIRGPRSTGCSLLDGTVNTVAAVTMRSTGTLSNADKNMGSFSIGLLNNGNATVANDNYLLTGNPYPSQVSFAALLAANNGASGINNGYAVYAPGNTVGNYAFWDGTTWTGGNTGLSDATGDIIANGQAFFVQGKLAGAGINLNWAEAMKTVAANNGYFRTQLNPNRLRIGYMLANGNKADEIMLQFRNNASSNEMNSGDIVSINTGTQHLKSLKAGRELAFNTRNLDFVNDTVMLHVASSSNGQFKLSFYDFDEFVAGTNARIYLVDKYTGTTQLMNANKDYPFTVSIADAASFGKNRFAVVFNKPVPVTIPVSINVRAYPSPFAGQLTVELPQLATGSYAVTLTDMFGRAALQQQAKSTVVLKTGKLAAGTYLLEVTSTNGDRFTQKIVK
jgi:hypothetical protein